LLEPQELTLGYIFAFIPTLILTLIPTPTIRIITHTAMATIILTTAAGFSAALGVDTLIVMIVAGSVAASAVDSAATLSVVAADFMAVADFVAVAVTADTDNSHESLIRTGFGIAAILLSQTHNGSRSPSAC
jgi:hypothetical protein